MVSMHHQKVLGVLIGTAVVMSLALVATKLRAQNDIDANLFFQIHTI